MSDIATLPYDDTLPAYNDDVSMEPEIKQHAAPLPASPAPGLLKPSRVLKQILDCERAKTPISRATVRMAMIYLLEGRDIAHESLYKELLNVAYQRRYTASEIFACLDMGIHDSGKCPFMFGMFVEAIKALPGLESNLRMAKSNSKRSGDAKVVESAKENQCILNNQIKNLNWLLHAIVSFAINVESAKVLIPTAALWRELRHELAKAEDFFLENGTLETSELSEPWRWSMTQVNSMRQICETLAVELLEEGGGAAVDTSAALLARVNAVEVAYADASRQLELKLAAAEQKAASAVDDLEFFRQTTKAAREENEKKQEELEQQEAKLKERQAEITELEYGKRAMLEDWNELVAEKKEVDAQLEEGKRMVLDLQKQLGESKQATLELQQQVRVLDAKNVEYQKELQHAHTFHAGFKRKMMEISESLESVSRRLGQEDQSSERPAKRARTE